MAQTEGLISETGRRIDLYLVLLLFRSWWLTEPVALRQIIQRKYR